MPLSLCHADGAYGVEEAFRPPVKLRKKSALAAEVKPRTTWKSDPPALFMIRRRRETPTGLRGPVSSWNYCSEWLMVLLLSLVG
jgi:hypothetical protein